MTAAGENVGIEVAEIDAALARKGAQLTFPPVLERLFEIETGAARARKLAVLTLIGLGLFAVYIAADALLTPDVVWVAVTLRLGIFIPLSLILVAATWFNVSPFIREAGAGACIVLAVFSTYIVMTLSQSPLRDAHIDVIVLAVLFVTLVQRLRFAYALACSAAIFAIFLFCLLALPDYPIDRVVTDTIVFACAMLLALWGGWYAERHERNFYLASLRARVVSATFEDKSLRDALTGLENRRGLTITLDALRNKAREGEDIAVVLFDIDQFKAYNDGLGSMAGDLCLKRIASLIGGVVRDATDTMFRVSGDELLVLLRRTDLHNALTVAERIRSTIEKAAIPHPTQGLVTASFGVAASRTGGGTGSVGSEELIATASNALEAAKRNGRNQVWPRSMRRTGGGLEVIPGGLASRS